MTEVGWRRAMAGLALALCLPLAACGDETPASAGSREDTTVAPGGSSPTDSGAATGAQLERAIADLAEHVGVEPEAVTVVRDEEVTWPDGSLGCPREGMVAITMLTPGRLIVLSAGGRTYEYHAGARTPPFRCDDPQPPLPDG